MAGKIEYRLFPQDGPGDLGTFYTFSTPELEKQNWQ